MFYKHPIRNKITQKGKFCLLPPMPTQNLIILSRNRHAFIDQFKPYGLDCKSKFS